MISRIFHMMVSLGFCAWMGSLSLFALTGLAMAGESWQNTLIASGQNQVVLYPQDPSKSAPVKGRILSLNSAKEQLVLLSSTGQKLTYDFADIYIVDFLAAHNQTKQAVVRTMAPTPGSSLIAEVLPQNITWQANSPASYQLKINTSSATTAPRQDSLQYQAKSIYFKAPHRLRIELVAQ